MRRTGRFAACAAGLILAAASVRFARSDPSEAFATSGAAIAGELVAGCALVASGLILAWRGAVTRFAGLLVAGGCGWFLLEWNNPGVGSALAFTIGLALYAVAPALIAHALLVYPAQPLGVLERIAVIAGYAVSLLLLGLLPAFAYDPRAEGCSQCPHNLLLVHASSALYRDLNRAGIYIGLGWSCLVIGLLARRLARSTVALRRMLAPVLVAGCVYLSLVAADFAASLRRGYLSNDSVDEGLLLGKAIALVALALALAWARWWRGRRTRSRLARLVVELSATPSSGGLEQALARSLGDPDLRLGYPLAGGAYVDATGHPCDPGPTSTALVRDEVEVARITHTPGLLDDPGLVEALAATARLALDHERLRAELLAHLRELQHSRARIVVASDTERRRLERDLHDGAQQRLVALALELGLLRARFSADPAPDGALLTRIARADSELRAALNELRGLAGGLFPAVLADEGLAAAVEALAEDQPGRLRIRSLPEQRLDAPTEAAAYRVIAESIGPALRTPVTVQARIDHGRLVVEVDAASAPTSLQHLEDRVGALDGRIEQHQVDGQVRIRAEIPCAL
jgi:signal transduction histidine kinase